MLMEKIEKFNNKEVFVRKNIAGFVEKVCNFFGYDLNHDRFKKVAYNEDGFNNSKEEKAKRIYDAYIYLLFNSKNVLTNKIINTFFYIYFGEAIDSNVSLRIARRHFDYLDKPVIESAINFHIDVYNEIDCVGDEDKTIISLMFFNYCLAKNEIPTLQMLCSDYEEYIEKRNKFLNDNKIELFDFLLNEVMNGKVQEKRYYENLTEISLKDIYCVFKKDEELLKSEYFIKHLSIFGSFAKGINRIDSDIDILVAINLDLTKEEKNKIIKKIKERYFNIFNRFIDVSEISQYLNDEFIKKLPYIKNIF